MPKADLHQLIRDILTHTTAPPVVAPYPYVFYERTGTEIISALRYIERAIDQWPRYEAVVKRHVGRVYRTATVELIETFERFLKQSAAVCIDAVSSYVTDDRFDIFTVKGTVLAAHFDSGGVGEALCESGTWLSNQVVNDRFRKTLSLPGGTGKFELFPQDNANRARHETLNLLWQIRHTIVHNVGMVTRSDATKLRILSQRLVNSPALLTPTRSDLRYIKAFLDDLAKEANSRIGTRLADVLTAFLQQSPGMFDSQQTADKISSQFQLPLTVGGAVGVVTPPT